MSSKHFGFKAFTTEVKKRKNRRNRKNIFYLALLLIGFGIFGIGFQSEQNHGIAEPNKSPNDSYQNASSYNRKFQLTSNQINWTNTDSLALVNSLAQAVLPETKVLQGVNLTERDANSGTFRIFLRVPRPEENSGLKNQCNYNNTQHYWFQFADYSSNKPITTAFVRANEMLELYLPVGVYKLRLASGKAEDWNGEEDLFGDEYIYEVKDKKFPEQTEQYDIIPNRRIDISLSCINPESTTEPVLKENHEINPTN